MVRAILFLGRLALVAALSAVARADVVLVVSTASPLTSLRQSQVAGIFLGRPVELPGTSRPQPVDQREGNGARDAFYHEIINWTPAQMKAHWSRIIFTGRGQPPRQLADDAAVKQFLARNPAAIGYINSENLDDNVRVLSITP